MTAHMLIALAGLRVGSYMQISFALLVLASPLPSRRLSADLHQPGSRKQQEWKGLDQRWAALIGERNNPDRDKWTVLEDDLRSFAKKYDIHLEEHASRTNQENKKPPGPGSEFAQCPPRDDVRNYRCNLFPGPKGVCRYVCVPLDTQVRADQK